MSVNLRWDQCCSEAGCTKPRHIGELCAPCFMAATAGRRAVELLWQQHVAPEQMEITTEQAHELGALYRLPAYLATGAAL